MGIALAAALTEYSKKPGWLLKSPSKILITQITGALMRTAVIRSRKQIKMRVVTTPKIQ